MIGYLLGRGELPSDDLPLDDVDTPDAVEEAPPRDATEVQDESVAENELSSSRTLPKLIRLSQGWQATPIRTGCDPLLRVRVLLGGAQSLVLGVWTEVRGELQSLEPVDETLRDRSGAYSFEIPDRLVCMYSAYGDTVIDPSGGPEPRRWRWCAGCHSAGYELEDGLLEYFSDRGAAVESLSQEIGWAHLERHREFVEERRTTGESLPYDADHYDVPVMTKMETEIRLHAVDAVSESPTGYRLEHVPVEP